MIDSRYSMIPSWFVAGAIVTLSACGGSDDDPAPIPPAAPQVSVDSSFKALTLSWPAATGADFYRVYFNADGSSGYEDISGNLTTTSYRVTLATHLTDWDDALYMVEACNSDGCTSSTALSVQSVMLDTIGYLKPGESQNEALFGFSLALSRDGSTAAVGAPNFNNGEAAEAGAVFLYTATDSGWQLRQRIDNPAEDDGAGDLFGYSLALNEDGSYLVVGAPFEDSSGTGVNSDAQDNAAENSGAVYTFSFSADTSNWELQDFIKASNTDAKDYFGLRVALSDSAKSLAISAPYEASAAAGINGDQTDNSIRLAGAVYIYQNDNGTWVPQAYVKPPLGSEKDAPCFDPLPPGITCYGTAPARFGYSLAFARDGQMLAIGSPGDNASGTGVNADPEDIKAKSSGAVHILTHEASGWDYSAYIKSINTAEEDDFGYALSLSSEGDILAVAAPLEDGSASGVFNSSQQGEDFFDGDTPAYGKENSGAVYLYTFNGDEWTATSYIKAENTDEMDVFGWSLALNAAGDTLAVGVPRDDSEYKGIGELWNSVGAPASGSVFVYTRTEDEWELHNYLKAPNTDANDTFGRTVALSGDGNTLLSAATGEDSTATGVDANQADNSGDNIGAVYIY